MTEYLKSLLSKCSTPEQFNREVNSCQHHNKVSVYKIDKILRRWYAEQCLVCGQKIGHFAIKTELSSNQKLDARLFDEKLEQAKWDILREMYQHQREQKNINFWTSYHNHLRSHRWSLIRDKVLKRDKYICCGCGTASATQVHHLTYERLGDEMLFDLVSICFDCHKKIHPDLER